MNLSAIVLNWNIACLIRPSYIYTEKTFKKTFKFLHLRAGPVVFRLRRPTPRRTWWMTVLHFRRTATAVRRRCSTTNWKTSSCCRRRRHRRRCFGRSPPGGVDFRRNRRSSFRRRQFSASAECREDDDAEIRMNRLPLPVHDRASSPHFRPRTRQRSNPSRRGPSTATV